jgi:hypothetical protein
MMLPAVQAIAKMRAIDIVVLAIAQTLIAGRGFPVDGCDPLTMFLAEESAHHLRCRLSFSMDRAEVMLLPA